MQEEVRKSGERSEFAKHALFAMLQKTVRTGLVVLLADAIVVLAQLFFAAATRVLLELQLLFVMHLGVVHVRLVNMKEPLGYMRCVNLLPEPLFHEGI